MNTPHKWAKEIKAWADGEIIEFSGDGVLWSECNSPFIPSFNGEYLFRIKPKKQTLWFNVYLNHDSGVTSQKAHGYGYASRKEADQRADCHRLMCVPVEIELPE